METHFNQISLRLNWIWDLTIQMIVMILMKIVREVKLKVIWNGNKHKAICKTIRKNRFIRSKGLNRKRRWNKVLIWEESHNQILHNAILNNFKTLKS
jgi:hypothetical protein